MKNFLIKILNLISETKSFRVHDHFFGYPIYKTNDSFSIYRYPSFQRKIVAAYDRSIVLQKGKKLYYYPNASNKFFRFRIVLSNRFLPGLIENSNIDKCLLLPYMRVIEQHQYKKSIRMIIITDKGQIYHNYPARRIDCDGISKQDDICKFEESAVWDLPTARYPSNNEHCACYERYYPGLPNDCYKYTPISNDSANFRDLYGNGGFKKYFSYCENGSEVILPRFYLHSRESASNSFHFIGGSTFDSKMNIMGTYRSNTNAGVRTCLFVTDDGGRNWFCKYEFADSGDYQFKQGNPEAWGENYGNRILSLDYNKDYSPNTLTFKKRELVFDSKKKFKWCQEIPIKRIQSGKYIVFETEVDHQLQTGNIVAINNKSDVSDSLKWMINNGISEISNGNNLLFKVRVLDAFSFELLECVSQSDHNVCCRHIHHINRVKDGWLCGTGEIYPNGRILYIQMKEADTFSIKKAFEHFEIFELNHGEMSVQRTMGTVIDSNTDINLIYASDHDTLEGYQYSNESVVFSRNSTGIFKGKLSDIDDRRKFRCVFEAVEPCFFFQKINNRFVFCGQRGELAISFDDCESWIVDSVDDAIIYYYGNCYDYYIFDRYVIKFKR